MIVILLNTAYNPGDADPGKTYPHVKVIAYHIYPDSKHIQLVPQYGSGNLSSSFWSAGVVTLGSKDIADTEYDLVLASASLAGELPLIASDRILHNWLLTNGYFSGSLLTSSL